MCGGGGDNNNNELELERMRQEEARRERRRENRIRRREERRADEAAAEETAKEEAAVLKEEEAVQEEETRDTAALDTAYAGGGSAIRNYFQSQGADPAAYESDIQGVINEIMNMIPSGADNPGTYWAGAPELAFGRAQTGARNAAGRELDRLFPVNFEQNRYASTMDDPILAAIESEHRLDAERYLDNLFNRNVITEGGRAAGLRDIDRQSAGAKAKLNQYGTSTIEQGRSAARNVAGAARQAGSTLNLGQAFDPNTFATQLDNEFNDFLQNLDVSIRGQVSGNLFDTSNLSTIAGAAQGAGNLAYNRRAVAGVTEDPPTLELDRLAGSTGIF